MLYVGFSVFLFFSTQIVVIYIFNEFSCHVFWDVLSI